MEYSDILHLPDYILLHTDILEDKIITNETPVQTNTYRYPKIHQEEVS